MQKILTLLFSVFLLTSCSSLNEFLKNLNNQTNSSNVKNNGDPTAFTYYTKKNNWNKDVVCECDKGEMKNNIVNCKLYTCRPRDCYSGTSETNIKLCNEKYQLSNDEKDKVLKEENWRPIGVKVVYKL